MVVELVTLIKACEPKTDTNRKTEIFGNCIFKISKTKIENLDFPFKSGISESKIQFIPL